MTRLTVRSVLVSGLALGLLPMVLGADVTSASEPGTGRGMTLKFAAVFGAAESGTELPEDLRAIRQGIEQSLEQWDLTADYSELKRVLRLSELEELMRWSSTTPGRSGTVDTRLSDEWRLELTYQFTDGKVALENRLFQGEKLVSAPRVLTVPGERAVLSTAHEDGTFLFIFVEVDLVRP